MTIGANRRQTAFTLIELTLVVFILLALIGLSIPLFKKSFSDLSAKDTSFTISKLINYAQEMSVLDRKNYKIVFDFQNGKYQLLEAVSSDKGIVYQKARGRFGKLFTLPQQVVLRGEKNQIIFYPDGRCDELKVNVLVKNEGYSVAVKRFGNMVEVKEVTIEQ